MPEEMISNIPTQPVLGESPVAPVVSAEPIADPVSVPQNLDKSDATTYPLGSQDTPPALDAQESVEDHRSILDRIMGIFSRGKKVEQPSQAQEPQVPSAPEAPAPPIQQ